MHSTVIHENGKDKEEGEERGEKHLETASDISRLVLNQIFSQQGSVNLVHGLPGAECTDVRDNCASEGAEWSRVIRTAASASGLSVLEGGVCHKGEPCAGNESL